MKISPMLLKEIIKTVEYTRDNRKFIRITEVDSCLVVATDNTTDPMLFDKNGRYLTKKYEQLNKVERSNPVIIYEKENTNEK